MQTRLDAFLCVRFPPECSSPWPDAEALVKGGNVLAALRDDPACETPAELSSDELVAIAFEHAGLVSQVTRLQANPLYITELVTMICTAAGQDQTFAAFTLSHVCGSWRAIILANRHLWSHLYIVLTDALLARNAPLLRSVARLYLARSVGTPLHIGLVDEVSHSGAARLASSLGAFVGLLNRHRRRWRTLSITELGQRCSYHLKWLFTPHPMLLDHPQLVSVVACPRREEIMDDSRSTALGDFRQVFSLVDAAASVASLHVVFYGSGRVAPFTFHHVRRLVFESTPDVLPSPHLPSFPGLQELSLICRPGQPASTVDVAQTPYTAAGITALIIHVTGSGPGILNHIRSLVLPSLRSVCFVSDPKGRPRGGSVEVAAVHELVMRLPSPSLAHLSFLNVAVDQKHLLTLLGALPSLETLAISHLSRPSTHLCREGDCVVECLGDPKFLPALHADGASLCGRRSKNAMNTLKRRSTQLA